MNEFYFVFSVWWIVIIVMIESEEITVISL